VGSVLFYLLKDIIVRFTEYWLICLGVIVVVLVMDSAGGGEHLPERREPALKEIIRTENLGSISARWRRSTRLP